MNANLNFIIQKMLSFCMHCCSTSCVSISLSLASFIMLLFGGGLIYLDHRLYGLEIWNLQELPNEDNESYDIE